MSKDEILDLLREKSENTLQTVLGIRIIGRDGDRVFGEMPVCADTYQSMGGLHGGASVAFAETLAGYAANLQVDFPDEYCVGVEINANHLKKVCDGKVFGTASPLRVGRRFHVWEVRITDPQGELVCVSRLTAAVLKNGDAH
ncbi:MAG: hotdog fold thioesterase [Candidatus Latescibacterota bacterium]